MKFTYCCNECGEEYEITPELMLCPSCAQKQVDEEPLRGILEVKVSGNLKRDWNILDLLPVEREYFPEIPVGGTPLWRPKSLQLEMGFPHLYMKDDTCNPTGSLKDRASYLVAAFAKKFNRDQIILASTGNAGSSMAGIGAAAGLRIKLYLPEKTPEAKMIQALQYGAEVIKVQGNYDTAYDISLKESIKSCGMSRNTGYNPMTIEGKKTAALEIYRDLGFVPDYIFVPVGDGVILSGIYKGFKDLKTIGLTSRVPTIIAVQAEGSAAIYRAFQSGSFTHPVNSNTLADSISVDIPRAGFLALKNLLNYNGVVLKVSDDEIIKAQHFLASKTGLFAEPAAAASLAGFLSMRERISTSSHIVLLITGSGLKDIESARKGLNLTEIEGER